MFCHTPSLGSDFINQHFRDHADDLQIINNSMDTVQINDLLTETSITLDFQIDGVVVIKRMVGLKVIIIFSNETLCPRLLKN